MELSEEQSDDESRDISDDTAHKLSIEVKELRRSGRSNKGMQTKPKFADKNFNKSAKKTAYLAKTANLESELQTFDEAVSHSLGITAGKQTTRTNGPL